MTRELLLEKNNCYVTPCYVLFELSKHFSVLIEKSGLSEQELLALLKILFSNIRILSRKELLAHGSEAFLIAQELDFYDVHYFAAALATKGVIWSNDKVLKKQDKIVVLNTQELLSLGILR